MVAPLRSLEEQTGQSFEIGRPSEPTAAEFEQFSGKGFGPTPPKSRPTSTPSHRGDVAANAPGAASSSAAAAAAPYAGAAAADHTPPAGRPTGKGGKRSREDSDTHHTRDVRTRGPPDLRQLPPAWWRGDVEIDRAGNPRYWCWYQKRWLSIDNEDGEYFWGWSNQRGGHVKYTTMTWAHCRSTGRIIRQLMPNFYRPDFDPNEAWS